VKSRAESYFKRVKRQAANATAEKHSWRESDQSDLFAGLPARLRTEGDRLVAEVVGLMEPASSLVRQSPADYHDLAVSIKQMRAALRLRRYRYSDLEVLHDEGTVLGVQPPRQYENEASPIEAASLFADALGKLTGILELATEDTGADAPSTMAAGSPLRPSTAFIMMAMDRDNPHLDDVCNTVKRCFADTSA